MPKVMSWNIGLDGVLTRRKHKQVANFIQGPHDYVCLQEVWNPWGAKRIAKGWKWAKYTWRSGLLSLARQPPLQASRLHYGVSSLSKWDFLVKKGAHISCFPWGTLVNTHLDAGGSLSSQKARKKQLWELTSKLAPIGSLIVAGDLNLAANRPADLDLLEGFQEWNVLASGIEHEHDYVLYRSLIPVVGDRIRFPVSDHWALFWEWDNETFIAGSD